MQDNIAFNCLSPHKEFLHDEVVEMTHLQTMIDTYDKCGVLYCIFKEREGFQYLIVVNTIEDKKRGDEDMSRFMNFGWYQYWKGFHSYMKFTAEGKYIGGFYS